MSRFRRCSPYSTLSLAGLTASSLMLAAVRVAGYVLASCGLIRRLYETNLVAALVQIETALEMFTKSGPGHLVLITLDTRR